MFHAQRIVRAALLTCSLLAGPAMAADYDPWEPVNTRVYAFNSYLDTLVLKPVAITYNRVVPSPMRTGVANFFYNINDLNVLANNVLQLKFRDAANDTGRLLINSTVGLGGLIDVASTAGLPRNNEDFGQTLGRWGVGPGPYVVLPFFGPSSLRDAFGFSVDSWVNPVRTVDDTATRDSLLVMSQIDQRARALQYETLIMGDEYIFVREAFLQQRQYLVTDGAANDYWDDDF
jgi:phospholipid-binding lipoprotein MlaA